MADLDITTRLIYEAQGQAAIDAASKALESNKRQIEYVKAAMVSIDAPTKAYEERLGSLARTHVELTQRMQTMQDQAKRGGSALDSLQQGSSKTGVALESLEKGGSKAGMAMLQMGYFADDLQYGLRGVVNNIPGLVASLGLGAGVAGVAGIAAVSFSQLVNHAGQLAELFGGGATQTEAERMKALADATHRTLEETMALDKYKREQAAGTAVVSGVPKAEAERQKTVQEALVEAGGPNLVKALAEQWAQQSAGGYAAMAERAEREKEGRIKAVEMGEALPGAEYAGEVWSTIKRNVVGLYDTQGQMEARIQAERDQRAKAMRADWEQSVAVSAARPENLAKIIGDIEAHPERFPAGAAAKLRAATPEGIAAKAQAKTAAELMKAEQATARGMAQRGMLEKDNPLLQQFLAGEVGLEGLGAMAPTIRGATLQSLKGREATARQAGLDPKAIGELQAQTQLLNDQTKIMRTDKFQPIPPRPVAGARRP